MWVAVDAFSRSTSMSVIDAAVASCGCSYHQAPLIISVRPSLLISAAAVNIARQGRFASITWRSQIDQASVTKILVRDRGPALHAFNIVPLARN